MIKAFRVAEVTSRELLGTRRTARYLTIFFSSTGYAHYFIIKKKAKVWVLIIYAPDTIIVQ